MDYREFVEKRRELKEQYAGTGPIAMRNEIGLALLRLMTDWYENPMDLAVESLKLGTWMSAASAQISEWYTRIGYLIGEDIVCPESEDVPNLAFRFVLEEESLSFGENWQPVNTVYDVFKEAQRQGVPCEIQLAHLVPGLEPGTKGYFISIRPFSPSTYEKRPVVEGIPI